MKARFERKICLKRNENKKKIDIDSWFSRENLKRLWLRLNLYTNRYAWGWHMRLNDIFLSASIEINLTQPWLGHVLRFRLKHSFSNNGSRTSLLFRCHGIQTEFESEYMDSISKGLTLKLRKRWTYHLTINIKPSLKSRLSAQFLSFFCS